jgi:hypothetical protein
MDLLDANQVRRWLSSMRKIEMRDDGSPRCRARRWFSPARKIEMMAHLDAETRRWLSLLPMAHAKELDQELLEHTSLGEHTRVIGRERNIF